MSDLFLQVWGPTTAQDAASSTAADDPTASLRAAALMTLKSKRRKQGTLPDTLSRSAAVPSQSFELDYGQDEPAAPSVSVTVKTEPKDEDDAQAREEGEISDSEPPATPVVQPKLGLLADVKPPIKESNKLPAPPKLPPIRTGTAISPKASEPASSVVSTSSMSMQLSWDTYPFVIDANHVRPGLAMTQEQYDMAKDIVLDLLGWGVPPEYLVDCGLSREIVYYVFVELNLRLPQNLDTTGIPRYEPPPSMPSTIMSTSAQRLDTVSVYAQQNESAPRSDQIPNHSSTKATEVAPQSLSAAATPFVPGNAPTPNLLDMEQQRRQELLARKAVLTSRKARQQALVSSSASTSSTATPAMPAPPEPQDVKMDVEPIPTKTVEDFLKTIGPSTETSKAPSPPSRLSSFDDMDVDEPIPGLSASSSFTSQPAISFVRTVPVSSDARAPSAAASDSSPPRELVRSPSQITPPNESDMDVDVVPGLSTEQAKASTNVAPSRRGTKRPVAADFVDMEPASSRTQLANGFASYNSPYHQAPVRRKTTVFAGLGGQRRCVIHLSDSEDEEMGEVDVKSNPYRPDSVRIERPSSRSIPLHPTAATRRVSPGGTHSGRLSPAALQAKEEEIRKMREMIAQRERERELKKIALSALKFDIRARGPRPRHRGTTPGPMRYLFRPSRWRMMILRHQLLLRICDLLQPAPMGLLKINNTQLFLQRRMMYFRMFSNTLPRATKASGYFIPITVKSTELHIKHRSLVTNRVKSASSAHMQRRRLRPPFAKMITKTAAETRNTRLSLQLTHLHWIGSPCSGYADSNSLYQMVVLRQCLLMSTQHEEVAQYLCAHAMASAGPQHNANDIKKALEDARRRNPANSFDGRVSEALISLGLG
ncbi:predicted protein [Postia placenta Mad-698-R]|uniref:Uncharacterized protein n=1 Tax=Postia placenta MAD-698-R-SB12 TaxID=670580 RepID=A0A1X6MUR4_9APHY|nr:hypothetical protein POSPLADRAFT_1067024 [Postia placenta MAD-698-R-SB12]EED81046.1 predicted protein [Postia placenta Mad-698-R]OSX60000.1 hypothetical protein POSPLADRAFT_1067024 [Postia placenta MAD-698-R-SB12]